MTEPPPAEGSFTYVDEFAEVIALLTDGVLCESSI
jgi:hypothetical protein